MGKERRQIRHFDQRGRATRVGSAPDLDFSLDNSWVDDPAGSPFLAIADIQFPAGEKKTTIPIGIQDDKKVGEGTNTIVWTLAENAAFGFKKEVYIFSEDDDTNPNINTLTFKPIQLIKGSPLKAVTILIEDNDGSPAPIKGTQANDKVKGTNNVDTVYGFAGKDSIWGLDGDDSLYGFEGDDVISGGRDDDYIYGLSGRDRLFGDIGNDVMDGGAGDDVVDGGHGFDRLFGWLGTDTLLGGKGIDELYAEGGDDALDGGEGDDILDGGTGTNQITTGDGADIVIVGKDGLSVINDFVGGSDRLQLVQNLTFESLDIVQSGLNTLVQFNGNTLVNLKNTDATTISAADFI